MSDKVQPDWVDHAAHEIVTWLKEHPTVIDLTTQPSMFVFAAFRIAEIIEKNFRERGTNATND